MVSKVVLAQDHEKRYITVLPSHHCVRQLEPIDLVSGSGSDQIANHVWSAWTVDAACLKTVKNVRLTTGRHRERDIPVLRQAGITC